LESDGCLLVVVEHQPPAGAVLAGVPLLSHRLGVVGSCGAGPRRSGTEGVSSLRREAGLPKACPSDGRCFHALGGLRIRASGPPCQFLRENLARLCQTFRHTFFSGPGSEVRSFVAGGPMSCFNRPAVTHVALFSSRWPLESVSTSCGAAQSGRAVQRGRRPPVGGTTRDQTDPDVCMRAGDRNAERSAGGCFETARRRDFPWPRLRERCVVPFVAKVPGVAG
jgi:hypothetical protein